MTAGQAEGAEIALRPPLNRSSSTAAGWSRGANVVVFQHGAPIASRRHVGKWLRFPSAGSWAFLQGRGGQDRQMAQIPQCRLMAFPPVRLRPDRVDLERPVPSRSAADASVLIDARCAPVKGRRPHLPGHGGLSREKRVRWTPGSEASRADDRSGWLRRTAL